MRSRWFAATALMFAVTPLFAATLEAPAAEEAGRVEIPSEASLELGPAPVLPALSLPAAADPFAAAAAVSAQLPKIDAALPAAQVPPSLSSIADGAPAAPSASEESARAQASKAFDGTPDAGVYVRGTRARKAPKATPPQSPYSDDEIVTMATELAREYKGSPWSETEYNAILYPAMDHLREVGVPERQVALFRDTCDKFPGRRFNPYSGD